MNKEINREIRKDLNIKETQLESTLKMMFK